VERLLSCLLPLTVSIPHEAPDVLREQIVEGETRAEGFGSRPHIMFCAFHATNSKRRCAGCRVQYGQADVSRALTSEAHRSWSRIQRAGSGFHSAVACRLLIHPRSRTIHFPRLPHIKPITADNNTANLAASVRFLHLQANHV